MVCVVWWSEGEDEDEDEGERDEGYLGQVFSSGCLSVRVRVCVCRWSKVVDDMM